MAEQFNWTELIAKAKAASFDPIPNANYHVSVHETEAVSSSTGKPMIKLKLNVEDGDHKNRKLLHQLVLSTDNEIALAIFFNHLKAFGIGPDFLAKCPPGQLGPIAQALLGKHAIAKVGQREWQGEMRNDVKGYLQMGAGSAASGALPGLAAGGTVSTPAGLPGLPTATGNQTPTANNGSGGNKPAPGLPGLPTGDTTAAMKAIKSETIKLTQGETAF